MHITPIEFGISMKLVRWLKMGVNETFSRVSVGRRTSDIFPIKMIWKKEMLYHHCFSTLLNLLTPNFNYSGCAAPLTSKIAFYIFIQQFKVLNILNMVCTLHFFFSSKCSLFHNSNLFDSSIIHNLYTECAKIKKIILAPKG